MDQQLTLSFSFRRGKVPLRAEEFKLDPDRREEAREEGRIHKRENVFVVVAATFIVLVPSPEIARWNDEPKVCVL